VTRTRAPLLLALATIGAVAGFLLQLGLGSAGAQKIVPELTLAATLVLIGAVVVALAVPVRRATRGAVRRRVDPFYATRVVLLAKACSVTGALLGGAAAGMLIELVMRPVSSAEGWWRLLAMLGAAVVVLVGGLVAEALCVVPPDDEDEPAGGAAA